MKTAKFIGKEEIGIPLVAEFLNTRFAGFLYKLAERTGQDFGKLNTIAAQILADAEVEQY